MDEIYIQMVKECIFPQNIKNIGGQINKVELSNPQSLSDFYIISPALVLPSMRACKHAKSPRSLGHQVVNTFPAGILSTYDLSTRPSLGIPQFKHSHENWDHKYSLGAAINNVYCDLSSRKEYPIILVILEIHHCNNEMQTSLSIHQPLLSI